jgi:3-deoxy-D-manno-octulosonic-acid transferase
MTMLVYSALLTLALVVSAPWWLLRMATTERYREGLGQRLGRVPGRLGAAFRGRRVVWIHAVSVGEVLAASRLVGGLEVALGEGWGVVISTTTRTGQALARERFGSERVFYMPLDFAFAVRAYLRALKPAAVILMESELWPRMLHECQRAGVPVAVVNARMSDRSFGRAMKARAVWGSVLRKPVLWLAQSSEDARRLLGVGVREEAVIVAGNLKYDIRAPKESRIAELIREAAGGRPIVVAGSTVGNPPDTEDALCVEQWLAMADLGIMSLLVLAPRHRENFEFAWSIIEKHGGARASNFLSSGIQASEKSAVILLDTIGDLAAVYGVADVAFVGGSLLKRGGHNPLEPAQFGVPIVMGPSFENFRDVVAGLRAEDAIVIVQDEAELGGAMIQLLMDPAFAKAMGERGRRVFEEQQGATARSVAALVAMIEGVKR